MHPSKSPAAHYRARQATSGMELELRALVVVACAHGTSLPRAGTCVGSRHSAPKQFSCQQTRGILHFRSTDADARSHEEWLDLLNADDVPAPTDHDRAKAIAALLARAKGSEPEE